MGIIALPLANYLVSESGLLGAALAYLSAISLLCITIVGMVIYHLRKGNRNAIDSSDYSN